MTAAIEALDTWGLAEGDALAPGRTVLRSLGGGRIYEVLLVWDERRLAVMVAKVVRPARLAARGTGDLRREADALARLTHPVLVRGFDADLDGPRPHLLIEHLEGPTLGSLLAQAGPLPLQQLLPLALHVASALHYIAGEGWAHLDVKPENIVMGVPPRLIDLSVARTLAAAAQLRGPVGTDGYMAPEQCDPRGDRGAVGPATDVWGLGATLYHALAGRRPFPLAARGERSGDEAPGRGRADPLVRFPQLSRAPEPLPAKVPAPLAGLVLAALAPRPADRPAAAELAAGLEPLVASLPRRLVLSGRARGR